MSKKVVVGVVLGVAVGLAIGTVAGRFALAPSGGESADAADELAAVQDERDRVAGEKDAAAAELENVKRHAGRLDRDLRTARAALAEAEARAATAEAAVEVADELVVPTEGPESGAAIGLGRGQAFSFPEYDEHLATIDWTDAGTHVGAMAPLLSQLMVSVAAGEQPSPEAVGGIQQHNGPLVTMAMKLHNKLPGETVNGAFSHPAAVVNVIVATLESLGKPLSAEQLVALERVGNEYVAEDRRRLDGYGDATLALERHADESLLKGRFYDAAMAVLTEEQHKLLRPEETRGRVTVDLFSASLVWVGRAQPVPFVDREGLAERLSNQIGRDLGLEGDDSDRFASLLSDWTANLPLELMEREPDALWLKGLMPIDAIDLAAKHQIALMKRILNEFDLSEDAVAELRDHKGAFVPTWRPQQ